jgi:hypothetical protein
MTSKASTITAPGVRQATLAVYTVFILSGFSFASWASRIPQVRDALSLSPRGLGLVLLAAAVGSIVSMPLRADRHCAARDRSHRRGHGRPRRRRHRDVGGRLPHRSRAGRRGLFLAASGSARGTLR